jgi:hypothetical protein
MWVLVGREKPHQVDHVYHAYTQVRGEASGL